MSQGGSSFGADPLGSPGGAPKRGMSTGVKVLLIVSGVFGVLAVLCCGGGFFAYNRIANSATKDPAQVQAIQRQIVDIQLPADMQPQGGMDMDLYWLQVKAAFFQGDENKVVVLLQLPGQISEADMRAKMQESLEKQGQENDMKILAREVRKITIDGQEIPFEFTRGQQEKSEQEVRQVVGVFPGREGTVILTYMLPESAWNEEEVMRMLRSIKK